MLIEIRICEWMMKNEKTKSLTMMINFLNEWVIQIFKQDVARMLKLRNFILDASFKSDT